MNNLFSDKEQFCLPSTDTLPTLIDRATTALVSARSSAEVLEARDMARVAYDAAKSAARIARAKTAHDSLIADVHRAQANALAIRARAEMRLAEEYDQAQERGEIRTQADNQHFSDGNKLKASDVLAPKEMHEARQIRDAEQADPGVTERALNGMVEAREEPTKAALRRSVIAAVADVKRPREGKSRCICFIRSFGHTRPHDPTYNRSRTKDPDLRETAPGDRTAHPPRHDHQRSL